MRVFLLGLVSLSGVLLGLASCRRTESSGASTPALFPVTVQLDWVAEPEHGAFYTAEALGFFRDEGLAVTLLQGGANAYSLSKVATGQAQLGQADSTNVLLAINSGAPLLNVAAIFQHDPSVLMLQEKNPVHRWEDLAGRSVMARPEWAFIPYVKKKYHLEFSVIPQNFDLGRLAVDSTFIQQGFYTAEPYYLRQKGVAVRFLYCWDAGFDAYTSLFTSRDFAAAHPQQLKAFLRALRRGYAVYLEKDFRPAHVIMLKVNPKVTPEYLEWSRSMILGASLAKTAEADYLVITRERFRRQIDQLEDLAIVPKGVLTVDKVMSDTFLPSGP